MFAARRNRIFSLKWAWVLMLGCSVNVFHMAIFVRSQDDIFTDCSLAEYYQDFAAQSNGEVSFVGSINQISDLLRRTHRNTLPYTSNSNVDVWDALIDLDSVDGIIRLIYSQNDVSALDYGTPATWNREHLWPRSQGVGSNGPDFTDVHALRPSDWNVNAARGNLWLGDCEDMCTFRPAHEEAAVDTAKNSEMFLPPQSVRGDIARAIFYMERRYSFFDEPNTEVLELTDCPDEELSYQMGYLSDLLRWHEEDPPDDDERVRNERICSRWQGNRNVFVDFPELVSQIHGSAAEKPYECYLGSASPAPAPIETPLTENPGSVGKSCSQLVAGDVQVVSFTSVNPDSVVLVALADLQVGIQLFMTDNAWTGSDFLSNEGTLRLVIPRDIASGEVFGYGDSTVIPFGDAWESVGSGSFALSTAGDSVIVFCLDEVDSSYRHLGAIISGSWASEDVQEFSTNDSRLPVSLKDVGAVAMEDRTENFMYAGPTRGGKDILLAYVADARNWESSNTVRLVYSRGNFDVHDPVIETSANDESSSSKSLLWNHRLCSIVLFASALVFGSF